MPLHVHDITVEPSGRFPRLVNQLVGEMQGNKRAGQPVIHEHHFPNTDMMRILVLWDQWEGLKVQERTAVVLDAYDKLYGEGTRDRIAYAMAMTYPEAKDAGLLPVQIQTMLIKGDTNSIEQARDAMIKQGASTLANPERPELLFPTVEEAQACIERLVGDLPNSRPIWGIVRDARCDTAD